MPGREHTSGRAAAEHVHETRATCHETPTSNDSPSGQAGQIRRLGSEGRYVAISVNASPWRIASRDQQAAYPRWPPLEK
jgi:hypothetical protein